MASRPLALGLVGHPVAHSRSPAIQRAALAASGLDGAYSLCDVAEVAGLDGWFAALRAGTLDGLNVTLPWKGEAAARCDEVVGDAALLGVVNTLVPAGGRVVGHNTDVAGLVAAARARWPGRDWSGVGAAVLGAGGAAYAAVLALARLGAGRVAVWNRTGERARALAARLAGLAPIEVTERAELASAGATLVVQAGSGEMGLAVGSAAYAQALAPARPIVAATAPDAVLIDLVYQPRRTVWVEAAALEGREADDGLAMLVHQARLAFALWTGVDVAAAALLAAAEASVG